jgi:hypothetical protein
MINKIYCGICFYYTNLKGSRVTVIGRLNRETDTVLKKLLILKNIDKCNTILCLSSRNMIDKTMCEVLCDYSDPWPTLPRSTSFFLIMLLNYIPDSNHTVKYSNLHEDVKTEQKCGKIKQRNMILTHFINSQYPFNKMHIWIKANLKGE